MADTFDDGALSQDELDALMNAVSSAEEASATAPGFVMETDEAEPTLSAAIADEGFVDADAAAEMIAQMQQSDAPEMPPPAPAPTGQAAKLQMASFDNPAFGAAGLGGSLGGFDRVQDIPLELTVELGRTRLLIKDILELGSGSIVELEKVAGEPVDLLANGLLIARGEVVVIDDNFGVRVTEVITSADRRALPEEPANAHAA